MESLVNPERFSRLTYPNYSPLCLSLLHKFYLAKYSSGCLIQFSLTVNRLCTWLILPVWYHYHYGKIFQMSTILWGFSVKLHLCMLLNKVVDGVCSEKVIKVHFSAAQTAPVSVCPTPSKHSISPKNNSTTQVQRPLKNPRRKLNFLEKVKLSPVWKAFP